MKKLFLLCTLTCVCYFAFAEQTNDTEFDGLFEDAIDIEVEESQIPKPDIKHEGELTESLKTIRFYGNLSSKIGFIQNVYPDFTFETAGFELTNNLAFSSRASDIFGVYANFLTTYPNYEFDINKFYFDYLLFDKFYFKAGRRPISWDNTKHNWEIFTQIPDTSNQPFTNDKNIVFDAKNILTASFTHYMGPSDIEFLLLHSASWGEALDAVKPENMSLAIRSNIVISSVAATLFGRIWATEDTAIQKPVLGVAIHTSLFNFDFYSHNTMHFDINKNNIKDLPWNTTQGSCVVGMTRVWQKPRIGLNTEFVLGWDKNDGFIPCLAIDFAISRLFNNTSRLAFSYELCEKNSFLTVIYEYYDLKDATFDIAFPISYNNAAEEDKVSIAMQLGLIFNFDY